MANKPKNQKSEHNQAVGEALSKTDIFFKENKKLIIYISSGVVAVAAIIALVIQFYFKPLREEAVGQTFVAEQYFRADNFEAALNGDGNSLGFAMIIDEYGAKGGQAVYFYAGICELKLGNYQNAVDYLVKYKGKNPIIRARALCCTGDAYVAMDELEKGLSYHEKAANYADNEFAAAYLLKGGIIAEELGNTTKALALYKTIKDKYPQTYEGYEIDKYIARIKIAE